MDTEKKKFDFREFLGNIWSWMKNQKRYLAAGLVFVIMLVMLATCVTPSAGSAAAAEAELSEEFSTEENPMLEGVLTGYYYCLATGDLTSLEAFVFPLSDMEKSYITFMSNYIEGYNDLKVYYKDGPEEGSYLVSVSLEMKFVDIDTPAPGLDFFYFVTTDNGSLAINNIYSSFNQTNNEYEMDPDIATVIAAYEQQDDVMALQQEVQTEWDQVMADNDDLNTFVNSTLNSAMVSWMSTYKTQQAQQEAIAAAKAQEEEAAAKEAAEKEAQEAEENANAKAGVMNDKVNVRSEASTNGNKLGQIAKGTKVTVYATEGDWYKIDYNGTRAYVKSEYVDLTGETATTTATDDDATADDDTAEDTAAVSNDFSKGDKITLSQTVNVRASMSETASKVAVVYAGESVTVQQSYSEGWTKVTYGKKEGYIKTELLK